MTRLTPKGITPRVFWTFQLLFWTSVFIWRSIFTAIHTGDLGRYDLRAISMSGSIFITLGLGFLIVRILPTRIKVIHGVIIFAATFVLALIHTAGDRALYAAGFNGWQVTAFSLHDYLEILSTNAWVYMSWAGYFIVILQFSRLRERENAIQNLQQAAKDARLKMLMHQLNPHFLFNTLNSLSALIADRGTEDAGQMLLRLSRFLRHVIDADQDEKTDLQSEIEIVRDYLSIQEVRFGERLNFELSLDPDCRDLLVPIMILQPLVENAFKHGCDEQSLKCSIRVEAHIEDGKLVIRTTDKGPGLPPNFSQSQGAGLKMIRDRLEAHYGDTGTLDLSNQPGGGVCAVLSLPLERTDGSTEGQLA